MNLLTTISILLFVLVKHANSLTAPGGGVPIQEESTFETADEDQDPQDHQND